MEEREEGLERGKGLRKPDVSGAEDEPCLLHHVVLLGSHRALWSRRQPRSPNLVRLQKLKVLRFLFTPSYNILLNLSYVHEICVEE